MNANLSFGELAHNMATVVHVGHSQVAKECFRYAQTIVLIEHFQANGAGRLAQTRSIQRLRTRATA